MAGAVTNGGFESYGGKSTAESMSISKGSGDLTGWTVKGQVRRIKGDSGAWSKPGAVEGSWIVGLHHKTGGSITTTLRELKPGSIHVLSWYERDRERKASKTVRVSVGGKVVSPEHVVPDTWTKREVAFKPDKATAVLEFYDKGGGDGTALLDAVTVTTAASGLSWGYGLGLAPGSGLHQWQSHFPFPTHSHHLLLSCAL